MTWSPSRETATQGQDELESALTVEIPTARNTTSLPLGRKHQLLAK